ncbi:hypothetical protein BgiBS90_028456 [Biomphalaria glabrata]|nr:hypothetical protein BgiBS90_028456 [Biomphalaria glabrata]
MGAPNSRQLYLASLLLFVLIHSCKIAAQNVAVTAKPDIILKGLTTSLAVNCTFEDGAVSSLVSLKVSRALNSETIGQVYEELASVNSFSSSNLINTSRENLTVSSSFAASGLSFLSLVWHSSDDLRTGTYKCEADYLDLTGHPKQVSNSAYVSGVSHESQMLVDEILSLKEENKVRETEALSYKELFLSFIASWNRKKNQTRDIIFTQSQEFNGSIYLLSRANVFDNTGIAQAVCEIYDSKLAEIESNEELEFVQNFMKNNTDLFYFYYIIIGGVNNEGVNGTWVSPDSGLPLDYLNWAPGYPNKDTYAKCLGLWSYVDWKMVNVNCFKESLDWPKKFLCERSLKK